MQTWPGSASKCLTSWPMMIPVVAMLPQCGRQSFGALIRCWLIWHWWTRSCPLCIGFCATGLWQRNLSRLGEPLLDFVEFCAGRGMLTRGMIYHGYRCAAFDINYDASHDMLSGPGLRLFLDALTSTRRRGMHWWGTKCSFLCESLHQCFWTKTPSMPGLEIRSATLSKRATNRQKWLRWGSFWELCVGCYRSWSSRPPVWCHAHLRSKMSLHFSISIAKWCGWVPTQARVQKPLQLWHPPSLDLSRLGRPKPIGLDAGLVMQGAEMEVGQESRTDWKLQSITHLSLAALWQSVLTLLCRWMAEMI